MAIDASKKAVLEQLGNPTEVARGLEDFRRAAKVLSSQHPRLIDRYPKQWVAVYNGKVRARGRTFRAVLEQLDKAGVPREHAIVRFIDKNQRTMILHATRQIR
jgi:pyrimidine operon attenuation protein/uracil phosphoribosyltransferase